MTCVPSGFRASGKRSSLRGLAIPRHPTLTSKKADRFGSPPATAHPSKYARKSRETTGLCQDLWILLKNPSGQKVTVKKTISDVSPGNSNRVQTKLARKNSRQFSCIFTHLQKRGVLQQNQNLSIDPRQHALKTGALGTAHPLRARVEA